MKFTTTSLKVTDSRQLTDGSRGCPSWRLAESAMDRPAIAGHVDPQAASVRVPRSARRAGCLMPSATGLADPRGALTVAPQSRAEQPRGPVRGHTPVAAQPGPSAGPAQNKGTKPRGTGGPRQRRGEARPLPGLPGFLSRRPRLAGPRGDVTPPGRRGLPW